jgi:mono/diheme cytochrome c family protein
VKSFFRLLLILIVVVAAAAAVPAYWPSLIWHDRVDPKADSKPDAKRGEYVFHLGGCAACHTAKGGKLLAGGRKLKSPFGTFTVPNITPDRDTGIGRWSARDFVRAMTLGLLPDGRHLYPAFPYPSYTKMSQRDLADLWAYLKTVPPVRNRTAGHDLAFPYSIRAGIGLWKLLYFDDAPFKPDADKSADWNRGAYIVTGPGHCGECHTPRNFLGGPIPSQALAGTKTGPDGDAVPNITPDKAHGIGKWTAQEITFALQTGLTPSGDVLGGAMAEVVDKDTGKLTDADRKAIATYLMSLPPRSGN